MKMVKTELFRSHQFNLKCLYYDINNVNNNINNINNKEFFTRVIWVGFLLSCDVGI